MWNDIMKKTAIAFGCVLLVMVGCKREQSTATNVDEKPAVLVKQRDDLRAVAKPQLDQANQTIVALEEKLKTASGEAKIATEKQLASLRQTRDSLQKDLDRAQAVGADAWEEFSRGVHRAVNDLQDATKKAADRLKQ